MNNNPFMNNQNNKMPPFMKMAPMKTPPIIKWIIVVIFGIIPFLLLIGFVGPNDMDSWRIDTVQKVSYGTMWGIGILTVLLASMAVSFIAYFSKDVRNDVIPLTVAFAFMWLGFYVIPLMNYWSLFFILIAPILFIVGYAIGAIGTFIAFIKKASKEMKKLQDDPEMQNQINEMMRQMGGQPPMQGFNQPKEVKPKDKKENYQDNPFVDVKPEDEDEEEK